jgi:hypothetical protein
MVGIWTKIDHESLSMILQVWRKIIAESNLLNNNFIFYLDVEIK